jgi:hypothetical protein
MDNRPTGHTEPPQISHQELQVRLRVPTEPSKVIKRQSIVNDRGCHPIIYKYTHQERFAMRIFEFIITPVDPITEWFKRVYSRWTPTISVPSNEELSEFMREAFAKWSYERLVRISAPDMIKKYYDAEKISKRQEEKSAIAEKISKRQEEKSAIATATPSIKWVNDYKAMINIGDDSSSLFFQAFVLFGTDGEGFFGRCWAPTVATKLKKRVNTGLFPRINACLQIITEQFVAKQKPTVLEIHGADGKRNAWNSKVYRNFRMPPDYRFYTIIGNEGRAATDGTIAVGWVKNDYVEEMKNRLGEEMVLH